MSKPKPKPKTKPKKPAGPVPLLLQKHLPERKRLGYVLYQAALLLLSCAILTLFTLLLSYVNLSSAVFRGYFANLRIPLMNLAVVTALCFFLFALVGKLWIAYLLTALLCLGVCIGNYYLVLIRNDPLQFADLFCLREALHITQTQHYELPLDGRVLFSVLGVLIVAVLLGFLSRCTLRLRWSRLVLFLFSVACGIGVLTLCADGEVWQSLRHYEHINTWSVTEIYLSRGVVYSFTRSAMTSSGRPAGYSEKEAKAVLASFAEEAIPESRKVDVFVVMRESYADLSTLDSDAGAIDWSCYELYHALAAESLTGRLVTNAFGGNTKNAERCFMTGCYTIRDWREPTNSYLWYLRTQGYFVTGAHPFDGWFYNRQNVNAYLGFTDYRFREDGLTDPDDPERILDDGELYDYILAQYREHCAESDAPYFHYALTYEGHGPYRYTSNRYARQFVRRDSHTADGYAMNNYLGCVYERDLALTDFVESLRRSERPVVLLTYGDHKATLGSDVNNYTTAAYKRFGMNMDLSTDEGFLNYYSTEYLIWMNDAAKALLGTDPAGETGPAVSPCYLMNVLFDRLGWGGGPAYLQMMREIMDTLPVVTTNGRVMQNGKLSATVSGAGVELYHRLQRLSYYWQNEFLYDAK